ncbi:MAG: YggS family pyridoxal phosphate-dependent enzyme [Candidatus Lambdaproteobacteria bacterium]|nr:YggS family pyridoxal phosphate-dependent enzyme [Candidatus Lambdaproteobacteria bacterium]
MTAHETRSEPAIAENLAAVRATIAEAARRSGRRAEDVRLIAVSKTKPLADILAAWRAGQQDFGENRVQEALGKMDQAPPELRWHLIGHLQSNKARLVPGRFAVVQSVDSERLAQALARHAEAAGVRQPIMVQLNWSGEDTKSGVTDLDALRVLVAAIAGLPALALTGLMTIPDPACSEAQTRAHYAQVRAALATLQREFALGPDFRELSMGMSHDYAWAIEEGATVVRVGTAIFGARP